MLSRHPLAACLPILLSVLVAPAWAVEDDLNATLIERTPKYNYDAVKNMPAPGDTVLFWGHIRYWGDESSPVLAEVPYQWRIDGEMVQAGVIGDFEPLRPPFAFDYVGYPNPSSDASMRDPANWPKDPYEYDPNAPPTGWRLVTLEWTWQDGRHTVELVVDPDNVIAEKSERNNVRKDYTDAISASFWVEESLWRYFHLHQYKLGVGSNSWEDWIQRQMAKQNELYERAVWPELTPNGVSTRVRIDRIIVVPDGILPVNGGLPSNNPDSSDKTIDLQWGFAASLLGGSMYANVTSPSESNPFFIEQSLIHELGHARYLIDSYGFNVHDNDPANRTIQIYENSQWIVGTYLPWVSQNDMVYLNKYGGVMSGPLGFVWGPYEAAMLERIAFDRARCGNMNSPCNIGEYLQELPQNNWFRFVDENGWRRSFVNLKIFRATGRPGVWYGKTFDGTPDAEYDAGEDGVINVGRNPFTGGPDIRHTYGLANSVMIIRVQQGEQVWYRFVECSDFNLEYYKGNTQDASYEIALDGPNNDSDEDGLPDDWELLYFDDLSHAPGVDEEPDGLTNLKELRNRTDPLDDDTDDDDLTDGEEVNTYNTDPLVPDTDGDGLTDGEEVLDAGTNPLNPDTDDDGFLDGADNCPAIYNPGQEDWDGDGIGDACAPGPRVDGVAVADATTVRVLFTVPVEEASAQATENYVITPSATVAAATLEDDQRTVTLQTSPLTPDVTYTLTLSGIHDREDPPHVIVPGTQAEFRYSSATRVTDGLTALYTFDEGAGTVVFDTSEAGAPLDLDITTPANAHWTLGGLSLDAACRVRSAVGATKIAGPAMAGGAFTVEAWIKPASVTQFGPARIVTMSTSNSSRNFTLAQGTNVGAGGTYTFFVRTTDGEQSVGSPGGTAALALQHVVVTRAASGLLAMYVNGREVASAPGSGDLSTWNSGYRLLLGNELLASAPWLGEFRLVATYGRALMADEVEQNFAAGADPTPPPAVKPGDCDCDGDVDFFDIDLFLAALGGESVWHDAYLSRFGVEPPCTFENCDCNGDGAVDFFDIDAFLDLLGT